MAEENSLEVSHAIADAPVVGGTLSVNSESSRDAEDDALTRRLVIYLCSFSHTSVCEPIQHSRYVHNYMFSNVVL